ncbi:MAG: hypothetical protein PCALPYG88_7175 [uncultured Paraburkholderia sp.]|nr:MAG: hypothetical protein PCALPYG08_7198 [uncultured Paraburkholderia sp.]CAH2942296.1 MAG: hypothetical protein PCALPYG88_7175 [uncultured Paraburkholderia sp.]
MRARMVARQILTAVFSLWTLCTFAQSTGGQPDTMASFLSAFRGKLVANVPEVSYNAIPASAAASAQYANANPVLVNRNQSDSLQPGSCPPSVDRLGCPGSYSPANGTRSATSTCPPGYQRDPTGCVMPAMPLHAHRIAGYVGWACDIGYARAGDGCSQVVVPVNAHPTDTASGWGCNFGYHLTGDRCAAVFIPANAHLAADGGRYECNYGYRDMGMSCAQ